MTASRGRPALVLKVPSRTEFLAVVRDASRCLAEVAGFSRTTAEQVALAVDEAATNVIEHAYQGATDRVFEVRYDDRGEDFKIEVVDNGATIDPRAMPRVDLKKFASEGRKGGLGVHLMSTIMDSVTFRRSARRNVCCLIRHKPKGSGSSDPKQ